MPSIGHEVLVDMVRRCPALTQELLATCAGHRLDGAFYVRLTAAEFVDLAPPEYRADAVFRVEDSRGVCKECWITEVQLRRDLQKRMSWPHYVTGARARLGCPVTLVVITLDPGVARWCREAIELDRAGNTFRPLVVGPDEIPIVMDMAQAEALPELAVLSTAAHGTAQVAEAALLACEALDEEQARLYRDFIYERLDSGRTAQSLEAWLSAYEQGKREIIRKQLRTRFGELPAQVIAYLNAAPVRKLDRFAERLVTASTLDQVFASFTGTGTG